MKPDLKPHVYADIFPMLSAAELKEMAADIKTTGQRQKIVLYKGLILDGRNRYKACQIADVAPKTEVFKGDDKAALEFVLSLNLNRRHLNESQRAMAAAKLAEFRHGGIREPNDPNGLGKDEGSKVSIDKAAERLNVSPRSVKSAKRILQNGSKRLLKMVESGQTSVSAAAAVSDLSEKKQDALATKGADAIAEQARKLRESAPTAPRGGLAAMKLDEEPKDKTGPKRFMWEIEQWFKNQNSAYSSSEVAGGKVMRKVREFAEAYLN